VDVTADNPHKHGAKALNSDYSPALKAILRRGRMAGWVLEQAWLDSRQVQDLPLSDREIFSRSDLPATPDEIYTLLTQRMSRVGRNDADTTKGGNPTKRIRMRFSGQADHAMDALGLVPANIDTLSRERLPADELKRVTADALWRAVEKLRNGFTGHQFGPSTDYDVLLEDNVRLPPKAVFGLAASEVLGYEVLPRRFSAGHSSPCFRIIKAARYTIVPKGNGEMATSITQLSATDREWTEGRPRLVSHLRRERRSGLAAAKKAAFIREHGKLFCERCGLIPRYPMVAVMAPHALRSITRPCGSAKWLRTATRPCWRTFSAFAPTVIGWSIGC
jgi:hypothetical protein